MVKRVAMLSAHTSPLAQPGCGAAGGMNVYVLETARQLARRGTDVEIFAPAGPDGAFVIELEPGLRVRQVESGGFGRALMRHPRPFDVIHSHYWISGQIALLAKERLGTPVVHVMHTLGRVKNLSLAAGEPAEPSGRITAESEIVGLADRLVANTARERDELVGLYGAEWDRIDIAHPGVDLAIFASGRRAESRKRLGIAPEEQLVVFAGRIQPHKGPDVLARAVAQTRRRPRLVIVGGPSGAGMRLADDVEVLPAVPHRQLADWYAAADLVCVPSHSESFGLVALEAQACGTPVVAARVGGLTTTVVDGVTGVLVDGHEPRDYADAIDHLLEDRATHAAMSAKAVVHASGFTWQSTADRLLDAYAKVVA